MYKKLFCPFCGKSQNKIYYSEVEDLLWINCSKCKKDAILYYGCDVKEIFGKYWEEIKRDFKKF